jgi:hypothetical protein
VVRCHLITASLCSIRVSTAGFGWLEGPVLGTEPAGAAHQDAQMAHPTQPRFVHGREWHRGGPVDRTDNRAHRACRHLLRSGEGRATFSGNPGATQTGKAKRWLAA